MSSVDEQFLPLDSSIKSASSPQYSTSLGYRTDSICGQDSEIFFLTSKISELQRNYAEMQKKYLRRIKELKEQLNEKNQAQNTLNYELSNLTKEYDEHKAEIQKISAQIKKSLEQNTEKQQKQTKLKSTSPKNHTNNSPKRLLKKSLDMVKKEVVQPKKQLLTKDVSSFQETNLSQNTQQSENKMSGSTEPTQEPKKLSDVEEQKSKTVYENPLNSSNQLKTQRKPLYSPPSQTNGPSPKKKLLFNSSKQLDLFSKPLLKKQTIGGSPPRRINISPTQKKAQNLVLENNHKMVLEKQIKKDLAVIDERPVRLEARENEAKKMSGLAGQKPSSPANRKKTSSPETAVGFMRKKISNKNLTLKSNLFQPLKDSKQTNTNQKQEAKDTRVDYRQVKNQQKIQVQKKATKSPTQSSKYAKMSPQGTKFSPGRKLIRNSPTHKKTESIVGGTQKPKLFSNMREKFDDNIFK